MKQRRGSVDNVAETLMSSLTASGESKENVAKAMIKALKATGASPEEIGKCLKKMRDTSPKLTWLKWRRAILKSFLDKKDVS